MATLAALAAEQLPGSAVDGVLLMVRAATAGVRKGVGLDVTMFQLVGCVEMGFVSWLLAIAPALGALGALARRFQVSKTLEFFSLIVFKLPTRSGIAEVAAGGRPDSEACQLAAGRPLGASQPLPSASKHAAAALAYRM